MARGGQRSRGSRFLSGRTLVTGGYNYIWLWDVSSGKELRRWEYRYGVSSVAFSPDGRAILTTGKDWSARLLDVVTGNEIGHFEHESKVNSFAVSPDGQTSLTAVETDMDARLWDSRATKIPRRLEGRLEAFRFARVAGTGNVILTDTFDPAFRIWDLGLGRDVDQRASRPDFKPVYAHRKEKTATLWGGGGRGAVVQRKYQGKVIQLLDDNKTALIRKEERKVLSSSGYGPYHSDDFAGYELYDLTTGERTVRYGLSCKTKDVLVSNDGRRVITIDDDAVYAWETANGAQICRIPHRGRTQLSVSSEARRILMTPVPSRFLPGGPRSRDKDVDEMMSCLWDTDRGRAIWGPSDDTRNFTTLSPDGRRVMKAWPDEFRVVDVETRKVVVFRTDRVPASVAFCPDPRSPLILCGTFPPGDGTIFPGETEAWICDFETEREVKPFGCKRQITYYAFSPSGRTVLTVGKGGTVCLWDPLTGQQVQQFVHKSQVTLATFSPDGCTLLTAGSDRVARLWDVAGGTEICQLTSSFDGSWIVTDPEGRFDTNSLDEIRGLQWVFPDDPFRPLSPETFMRDCFEPRLLPRLLNPAERARLRRIRPLAELNRVQPVVRVAGVASGDAPDVARVTVEVEAAEDTFLRGGKPEVMRTGVYDVRLFRDGQLVGRWPEPAEADDALPEPDPTSSSDMAAWRAANLARPDGRRAVAVVGPGGKLTITFDVRLPREPGRKVQFMAYAFNKDRVKSATTPPAVYTEPAAKPRAYVVAFGAEAFSDPDWDLRFAAADARLVLAELGARLVLAGYDVVPVALVSPHDALQRGEAAATKAHLQAVLARLAGREADPGAGAVPGFDKLAAATPDDLVLVFASSHGYTDAEGAYYLLPADIGPPRPNSIYEVDQALLGHCVSSGELSSWLRRIDAGQFALVVDACHAAATVDQPGFKPGPMGSRGLGQLAYDKKMRVLAASAADDVAIETQALGQGLLTYALMREGLDQRRAARDSKLTLGGLLAYGDARMPSLYGEVLAGRVKGPVGQPAEGVHILVVKPGAGGEQLPAPRAKGRVVRLGGEEPPAGSTLRKPLAFQPPTLFDYAKGRGDVSLDEGR